MSKELLEAIHKLDIRVFSTVSGKQLIGQVSYDDAKIILSSPLEFVKKLDPESNTLKTVLSTPIIENTAPIILYPHAIESESIADVRLKKIYCDQLVYNTLTILTDDFIDSFEESESDETESGYFNSIINDWNN